MAHHGTAGAKPHLCGCTWWYKIGVQGLQKTSAVLGLCCLEKHRHWSGWIISSFSILWPVSADPSTAVTEYSYVYARHKNVCVCVSSSSSIKKLFKHTVTHPARCGPLSRLVVKTPISPGCMDVYGIWLMGVINKTNFRGPPGDGLPCAVQASEPRNSFALKMWRGWWRPPLACGKNKAHGRMV